MTSLIVFEDAAADVVEDVAASAVVAAAASEEDEAAVAVEAAVSVAVAAGKFISRSTPILNPTLKAAVAVDAVADVVRAVSAGVTSLNLTSSIRMKNLNDLY